MRLSIRNAETDTCVEVESGTTVLKAVQLAGVPIDAPCGGHGTCKKCRVLIHNAEGVNFKLACQTMAEDGMVVVVPSHSEMVVAQSGVGQENPWGLDECEGNAGCSVAIDVGTTTVVCRLYNLKTGQIMGTAGVSNPQIAFGADVLSRITACADGALQPMEENIASELVGMIRELTRAAGVTCANIKRVVLAGNTVMETIAAGIDPTPLGVSPFTPPTLFGTDVHLPAFAEAGICEGNVLFTSCIAAYVGGDITADMLALNMQRSPELTLMIDLGTNGEMALGNNEGIVSCATAAGPVFEGACIKYGMPAYEGAISQVAFNDGQLVCTTVGNEHPIGICGTGIIDAIALMLDHGLIDESGAIVDADEVDETVSQGLEAHLGLDDDQPALILQDGVAITQKDVRQLQLAKAAICAGVRTLIDMRGCSLGDIDQLVIAGGFGSYLNLRNAARVGLFPSELLSCAQSKGNLAIEGASLMSLSAAARNEALGIADTCDYVELSTSAAFNSFYVDEMSFEE